MSLTDYEDILRARIESRKHTKKTPGETLRTLRTKQDLTLADVSRKTNLQVSTGSLSQWERDIHAPSIESFIEAINALGGSVEVKLGAETWPLKSRP